MKKILMLLIIAFVPLIVLGQNPPVLRIVPVEDTYSDDFEDKTGDYIKDTQNILNQYEGTWQYSQNGIEFTLKLTKVPLVLLSFSDNFYEYYDEIIATYRLVHNNNVLIDNLNTIPDPNNLNLQIFDSFYNGSSPNFINGIFTDLTRNISYHCEITFLPALPPNSPKIKFNVYHMERVVLAPDGVPQLPVNPTSPVPIHSLNDIELTKVD